MSSAILRPALLAIAAAVLTACSSMPTATSLLDQTHADYQAMQTNPDAARYAPLEMKKASEAMVAADAAASANSSPARIDQLAYLARQQIALTQEVSKEKTASAEQERSAAAREQIRLEQRTREAETAKQAAEQARLAALQSQNDAAGARQATDDAQRATREAQAKTAQLQAQLAELSAKQTERGLVITLGDVLFGTDMSGLTAEGMRTARKLAEVLQQNPKRTVLVEGFTDSTGSAAHNQQLSERRAGAVRSALTQLGVSADRVATRGYGEAYPVASNANASERQMNRRVEIVLSDENGKTVAR